MKEERVVHSFQKNPEEEVRFSLREYKERYYLDLRLWFLPKNGAEYHPTMKGITLSIDHLSELRKGLERAGKMVTEMALQQTSNSVK